MNKTHVWQPLNGNQPIGQLTKNGMEQLLLDRNPQVVPIKQVVPGLGGVGLVTRYYISVDGIIMGRGGQPLSWETPQEAQAYLDKRVAGYRVVRTAREEGLEMFWDVEVWGYLTLPGTEGDEPDPVRYHQPNVKAPDEETAVLQIVGIHWQPCQVECTVGYKDTPHQLLIPRNPDRSGKLVIPGAGLRHYATPVDMERLYWLNGTAPHPQD